ncbi:hypothetical protein ANO11243_042650 [Dothideomycetidae sp. 11243]|nr:hypothetical protein ANO11243_042650 [fungal sp. No.11243]
MTQEKSSHLDYLRSKGVFTTPSDDICRLLLTSYFRWSHTSFPVINQIDFAAQYAKQAVPLLLMQAVLFVGATHCDDQAVSAAGYPDRHTAKSVFYNRAKDIYDADLESDPVTVIQALFLMSFWRGGPFEKKDTRHWLGAAITLAQTKAFHRATRGKSPQLDMLKRRIWWSLYIRERQCASALGLPFRIRDEDCDVDSLVQQDLFDEVCPSSEVFEPLTLQSVHYIIQMCELSTALGQIVCSTYLPDKRVSAAQTGQIRGQLREWQDKLPRMLRLGQDGEADSFYPYLLHMTHDNLVILVQRSAFLDQSRDPNDVQSKAVVQAACRITRLLEDLMSNGDISHAPLHLVTVIFNALCIHTLISSRNTGAAKSVAEHRARLCLMGLKELGTRWEMTEWTLQLFLQYLDRSMVQRLQPPRETVQEDDQTTAANGLVALQHATTMEMPDGRNGDVRSGGANGIEQQNIDDVLLNQIENDFSFGEGNGFAFDGSDSDLMAFLQLSAFSPAAGV